MKSEICPICEEGVLTEHQEWERFGGRTVRSNYSTCGWCKSELTTPEQARYNKEQMVGSSDNPKNNP